MPYVDAGDIWLYYEEQGRGTPLVLLHGGTGTIDADSGWSRLRPVLNAGHTVQDTHPQIVGPALLDFLARRGILGPPSIRPLVERHSIARSNSSTAMPVHHRPSCRHGGGWNAPRD